MSNPATHRTPKLPASMKKWWRRKPFDPRKKGSLRQRSISTAIDEALQSEKVERRRKIEILVLGTPSATSRFLDDFDCRVKPRPNPDGNDGQGASPEAIVEACASQKEGIPETDQVLDVADVSTTSKELPPSIESELAELAGETYRMSTFSEYRPLHEGPHEVDVLASSYLLNATYAKASHEDRTALRCAIRPDRTAIENQVHHQTSTIDTSSIPARSSPTTNFTFCLHLLREHSPAHPKTCGFFEDCRNVVFILDVNTLHELHPTGNVTNAVWAMHRIRTLDYRCYQRRIFLNFSGAAAFFDSMADRSADEYLARLFDDYNPEGNVRRHDRPGHTVLGYLLERFSDLVGGGLELFCFVGDEQYRYMRVYDAIIEQYLHPHLAHHNLSGGHAIYTA